MTARVFENPHVRIPPTLFFDIEIPVRPFKYKRNTQKTSAQLEFIDFGIEDWRELPEREFLFPVNPADGYIDGSLYLWSDSEGGGHNPADATRMRFGRLRGKTLPASIDIMFDFTQEGFDALGTISVTWDVKLKIDPDALDAACEEARRVVKKRRVKRRTR
jgi:hypothetical protein